MGSGDLYTDEFYSNMYEGNYAVAIEFMPYIIRKLKPKSIVDVGGGQGIFLAVAKKYGVNDVLCIDGSYVNVEKLLIDKKEFMPFDLSSKCILERKFDLALSLEVAEHITPEQADVFVDNLVNMSDIIVFSAAIPKQGGTGHVNEQWASYWIEKFSDKGYKTSNCLRKIFWNNKNIIPLRRQNMLFFVKNEKENKLIDCFEKDTENIFDIVHPEVYMEKINCMEKQIDNFRRMIERKNRIIDLILKQEPSIVTKSVSKWEFWMAVDNLDVFEYFCDEKTGYLLMLEQLELFEKKTGSRDYILFGTGKDGKKVKRLLELLGKNVVNWCDTYLAGTVVAGHKIVSLENVYSSYNGEIIIIASRKYCEEMKKQILKYDMSLETKIFN